MGINRDQALNECQPDMELAFSVAEYKERLARVRQRMERDGIDVLWLMAPESLYYISGYKCEWYQAQSPKQWPATSGIAIHRDHDRFIMFVRKTTGQTSEARESSVVSVSEDRTVIVS